MKRRGDWRALWRLHTAEHPGLLAGGAALAALTVAMGMALLGIAGWFISATALAGLQVASAIAFDVFMPSAAIRLLALGRTAARYGERLLTHDATLSFSARLREQLFRGWARPEAAYRLLARPARLLFRLTGDIDALESLYLRVAVPALACVGAAALAGAVLGAGLAPALGLALAAWLLASGAALAAWIAWRARLPSMRRGLLLEGLRARVVDLVAGQTELVMAGRVHAQCEAVLRSEQRLARADHQLHRLETRAGLAWGVGSTLALCGTLLAAGALVEAGRIGAPLAALGVLLVLGAFEPFAALRRGALELGRSALAVRRLAPHLAAAPTASRAAASPASVAAPSAEGAIAVQLDGVALAHAGSPRSALPCVHLRIGTGEQVALVGPSGAGKSTLLAAIAGELAPRAGTLRAAPACWFTQHTELFQDSLADNLRLADPQADEARLWEVLALAGLAQDVRAMAHGLDARLGEGGLGLSGGQARRLALARLLLRGGTLWLLDEPSEALDTGTARDVLACLARQAAGRTLVVATHLRREAALADRLVVVHDGRIAADVQRGTPAFEAMLGTLRQD